MELISPKSAKGHRGWRAAAPLTFAVCARPAAAHDTAGEIAEALENTGERIDVVGAELAELGEKALELLNATALVGAALGAAGVFGVAIGFAFRDIAENYLAGLLLSVRHPFAPNDLVSIDGDEGKVVRLTSRATVLLTLEGNHLRVPNAKVFKAVVLNYTKTRCGESSAAGLAPQRGTSRAWRHCHGRSTRCSS